MVLFFGVLAFHHPSLLFFFFFCFFFLLSFFVEASTPLWATFTPSLPPPSSWRPRTATLCTSGAGEVHRPSWWLLLLQCRFRARSSRVFSTLMPKCWLGQVALTQFQPNPKKCKTTTTTTTKIVVYTTILIHTHFFLFWALPIFESL